MSYVYNEMGIISPNDKCNENHIECLFAQSLDMTCHWLLNDISSINGSDKNIEPVVYCI